MSVRWVARSSRRWPHILPRSLARLCGGLLACLSVAGCGSGASPPSHVTEVPVGTSTMQIATSEDGRRWILVGEPGAVDPTVGAVTAIELTTGRVFEAPVEEDGGFVIDIGGTQGYFVVVPRRVAVDDEGIARDLVGYAMEAGRNPASVISVGPKSFEETIADLGLTCVAQALAAEGAINRALEGVDRSCRSATDCALVPLTNPCTTQCGSAVVAAPAAGALAGSIEDLTVDVCPAFQPGGECKRREVGCPGFPPDRWSLACRFGACRLVFSDHECGGEAVDVSWVRYLSGSDPQQSVQYAFSPLAYNRVERRSPDGSMCSSILATCTPASAVNELFAAAAHPDVVGAMEAGGAIDTGSAAERIRVDIQPVDLDAPVRLDFAVCGECEVPEGLVGLAEALARLESEACSKVQASVKD